VKIPSLHGGKYYTIGLVVENSEGRDYDSFGFQIPA
jgi:hypothetical protein